MSAAATPPPPDAPHQHQYVRETLASTQQTIHHTYETVKNSASILSWAFSKVETVASYAIAPVTNAMVNTIGNPLLNTVDGVVGVVHDKVFPGQTASTTTVTTQSQPLPTPTPAPVAPVHTTPSRPTSQPVVAQANEAPEAPPTAPSMSAPAAPPMAPAMDAPAAPPMAPSLDAPAAPPMAPSLGAPAAPPMAPTFSASPSRSPAPAAPRPAVSGDRAALLSSIQGGVKLKKAKTNDRSSAIVGRDTKSGGDGGSSSSGGGSSSGGQPPSGGVGFGNIFAGGMPQLKKVTPGGGARR